MVDEIRRFFLGFPDLSSVGFALAIVYYFTRYVVYPKVNERDEYLGKLVHFFGLIILLVSIYCLLWAAYR